MAFNVGELVAYLRLDYSDFERGATTAQTTADKLDGKTVDIKVDADTALAEAKFAEVAAQEDRVDEGNKRVAASGHQAGRGMGALANAIILLGPALVPVIVGTAALTVGFGAMASAGILAIVGIKQQMAAGTAVGDAYTAMLATLKADLATLSATAARGVLGPFQWAVGDLQSKMPLLNGLIGDFSSVTGKAAGSLVTGLVAAFISLAPLARDASTYILGLSNRFAAMMSGPGVVSFGDYARSVFPQVMRAITDVGDAVIHLVAAIAPLGMGSLSILQMFAGVINAIPVNVLSALAQTASAAYLGISAFKLLTGPLEALSAAMLASGTAAEVVAAGIRSLTIAAGVIGAVLGLATIVFSAFADSQRKNTQAANDFADALRQDNGLLGENVRQMTAKKLSDAGALAAANKLGISLPLLTDAVLNQGDAMAKVTAITDAATNNYKDSSAAAQNRAIAADTVAKAVGAENAQLQDGVQKYKDLTAATATTTAAIKPATSAMDAFAANIGTTAVALANATTGQQTTAAAAANAAAKMYIENDAAGILKGSLDSLNGKALNAAQAQNSFDSSLANMGDHLTTTGKKVQFTTTSIGDMSTASVALRGQLNGQVENLQAVVEANGGLSESTGKAREQMVTMRKQIIDNAVAHGVDKAAVTAYVDNLLKIPATVPPTKLDVEKSIAEQKVAAFQALVNGVHGNTVTLSVTAAFDATVAAVLAGQRANIKLNLPGNAAGGLITGPGSSTSDSILGVNAAGVPITRVSANEFVVNAAATAKNRALLEAINSGKQVGGAGGGAVINVYPSQGMNEEGIAMAVAMRLNMLAAV